MSEVLNGAKGTLRINGQVFEIGNVTIKTVDRETGETKYICNLSEPIAVHFESAKISGDFKRITKKMRRAWLKENRPDKRQRRKLRRLHKFYLQWELER